MNRNTRKYGRVVNPKKSQDLVKVYDGNGGELEVLLPKNRTLIVQKSMTNRACEISPDCKDFAQFTNCAYAEDQYQNQLIEQYGFDPVLPEAVSQARELRKVLFDVSSTRVENSSQCIDSETRVTIESLLESPNEVSWHEVGGVDPLITEKESKYLPLVPANVKKENGFESPANIRITDEPRVKTIAEKYCKYKKKNVELRKLEEKIACIEYDIYDQDSPDPRPVQTMRAYFSMKPCCSGQHEEGVPKRPISGIPSSIKRKFQISEEDLKKLSEKEIEILDGQIAENRPYLDDLKILLKRKQAINTKKNRETLDLGSLYEMAKRETVAVDYDFSYTNLLAKAELTEVKDLILQQCTSARGIDRRTIRPDKSDNRNETQSAISQITFMEVLRNK